MFKNIVNAISPKHLRTLYWLIFLLMLIDRFYVLHWFGFRYTGNDDTLLWQGASDYMRGIFHEPFFYGQNYNYMVEALFAVPLLWLGVPIQYALPLVTSFMALAPFISFSIFHFLRKELSSAFFFILIPLVLPVEYGMMTTMSRGFVNGLFFIALIPFILKDDMNNVRFFFSGLFLALACVVNPNSLVVALPLLVYGLLKYFRNPKFYLFTFLGCALPVVLNNLVLKFYEIHPENLVHELGYWRLTFYFSLVAEAFEKLDLMFMHLFPVFWHYDGWAFSLLVSLTLILLLQKKYFYAVAAMSCLVVIVYSFGYGKVHDGFDIVFLPVSRMFLAVPMLYGILLSWVFSKNKNSRPAIYAAISLSIFFFAHKSMIAKTRIEKITAQNDYGPIAIVPVEKLKADCLQLNLFAGKYDAELLVCIERNCKVPYLEFRNYGCAEIEKEFPKTLFTKWDRRTWRFKEEEKEIRTNILFLGGDDELLDEIKQKGVETVKCSDSPYIFLVKNNKLNTIELLRNLGIEVRAY